jgi:alkanesulfonate monooxygenase SsuD/methylene tetrahydromethanopterin reductase-like flavin-dependent oxidoreductase (luciferase family)
MRFGAFWQTPGYEGSSISRRHWETIEEIVLAEQLGVDNAWLAESVFYPTRPMSNPLMVAIAAAQHTERIRFGTLATQTPLHHPFHLATQSATCDILTRGRLDFCLGGRWGARTGKFFGQGDISSAESRARVAEAINLIKLAWTHDRVTFQGQYWRADNLPILPQPVQRPHPPLLLAANSNASFAYAARLGLGVVGTTLSQPLPRMAQRLAEYEAAKPTHGVTQPQRAYVMVSFFVAKTRQEALAAAGENWRATDTADGIAYMRSLDIDPSQPDFATGATGWMTWDFAKAKTICIYDDPSGCVARLQELQERLPSMHQCILEFNRRARIPSAQVQDAMRLFADRVMPHLCAAPPPTERAAVAPRSVSARRSGAPRRRQ